MPGSILNSKIMVIKGFFKSESGLIYLSILTIIILEIISVWLILK
jgi:hypothetical protein